MKVKGKKHFDEWFVDGGWYLFLAALLPLALVVSILISWIGG